VIVVRGRPDVPPKGGTCPVKWRRHYITISTVAPMKLPWRIALRSLNGAEA